MVFTPVQNLDVWFDATNNYGTSARKTLSRFVAGD
jgi:hypothetical protein